MTHFKTNINWIDRLLQNGVVVIISQSNYEKAFNWAGKNIENFKWLAMNTMTKVPNYHFYFENPNDAMIFKLKWR
jgi:hypothetical protein